MRHPARRRQSRVLRGCRHRRVHRTSQQRQEREGLPKIRTPRLSRGRGCPHPVVTAIAGACAGGGLELAAVTDIRIAGASARFGVPIKRLGLVVSYDEIKRMLRIVSPAVAPSFSSRARCIPQRMPCAWTLEPGGSRRRRFQREPGNGRAHRRRCASSRTLAQEVHQARHAHPGSDLEHGSRRGLRMLRHGGLPHRVSVLASRKPNPHLRANEPTAQQLKTCDGPPVRCTNI